MSDSIGVTMLGVHLQSILSLMKEESERKRKQAVIEYAEACVTLSIYKQNDSVGLSVEETKFNMSKILYSYPDIEKDALKFIDFVDGAKFQTVQEAQDKRVKNW